MGFRARCPLVRPCPAGLANLHISQCAHHWQTHHMYVYTLVSFPLKETRLRSSNPNKALAPMRSSQGFSPSPSSHLAVVPNQEPSQSASCNSDLLLVPTQDYAFVSCVGFGFEEFWLQGQGTTQPYRMVYLYGEASQVLCALSMTLMDSFRFRGCLHRCASLKPQRKLTLCLPGGVTFTSPQGRVQSYNLLILRRSLLTVQKAGLLITVPFLGVPTAATA